VTALATQIVDAGQLLRVVAAALVAGIGVSLAFSLVIYGAVRAGERRQQARTISAGGYALLATLALLGCLSAVAFGVIVMLTK
jgi:hypothetical protein